MANIKGTREPHKAGALDMKISWANSIQGHGFRCAAAEKGHRCESQSGFCLFSARRESKIERFSN
jgi:hypothetical protein